MPVRPRDLARSDNTKRCVATGNESAKAKLKVIEGGHTHLLYKRWLN